MVGEGLADACTVSVVIPARDEAATIGDALAALAAQQDLAGRPLPPDSYDVILLANNCQDETANVARRAARVYPDLALHVMEADLPPGAAHVGAARRLAMDEACRRLLTAGRPRGIVATTDADTLVSPTWIAATCAEVERGAEAVGGRILVAAHERHAMAPAVRRRFLRNVGYAMLTSEVEACIDPRPGDPWPRHEQFSGASLAVTARAYHEVGGLPPLPSSEDVALGAALRRADIEIRHSLAVRVCTSGRLDGRAPSGLAALLAGWAGLTSDEAFQRVPSAANVVDRVTCRRALRDLWERARERREVSASEVARLSAFAGVSEPWLRCALVSAERFGVLLDAVEARSAWYRDPDLVDVRVALADLRAWLAHDRQHAIRVMPKPTLAALEQVEAVGPLPEPTQVA